MTQILYYNIDLVVSAIADDNRVHEFRHINRGQHDTMSDTIDALQRMNIHIDDLNKVLDDQHALQEYLERNSQ